MSQRVHSLKYRYLKKNCTPYNIYSRDGHIDIPKDIPLEPDLQNIDNLNDAAIDENDDEHEPYQYYDSDFDFESGDDNDSPYELASVSINANYDNDISIQNDGIDMSNSPNLIPNSNNELISFLRDWSNRFSVTHVQMSTLLKGLNSHLSLNLPTDARTILKTERTTDIQVLSGISGNDGRYAYLGISQNLQRMLSSDKILSKIKTNILELIFNVDGIPVNKSTINQFWPILGKIFIADFNIHPFVIALYYGDSKPNLQSFLDQFIIEVNELLTNGFSFNTKRYVVRVLAITCDAPARAFLKAIVGHNGTYGCERCIQKGESIQRHMVFKSVKSIPRTDAGFRTQEQKPHHNDVTPLLKIHNLNIINVFVLDYMHLCCIGIMKRLLRYWFKETGKNKLHIRDKNKVSDYLLHIRHYLPSEFSRKSRSLKELENWKATELRSFLLYTGVIVMKNILPNQLYTHFLLFHCALRILLSEKVFALCNIQLAQTLLEEFVKNCPLIYGRFSAVYNVHSLLHICEDAQNLRLPLDEISCFSFESYLGKLVKLIRTPHKPLAQVLKRLSENQSLSFEKQTVDSETCINLNLYCLSSVNSKDGFVLLKNGSIINITKFEENFVYGNVCVNVQDYYTYPIPSSTVGIYRFENISNKLIHFTKNEIHNKMVVVKSNCGKKNYVAIEMLHGSKN